MSTLNDFFCTFDSAAEESGTIDFGLLSEDAYMMSSMSKECLFDCVSSCINNIFSATPAVQSKDGLWCLDSHCIDSLDAEFVLLVRIHTSAETF